MNDLQKLQKRARDKEYKLRRRGASEAEIYRESPRKPWAAVQQMTPGQQARYASQLERFNSRKNRFEVVGEGVVAPYGTERRLHEAVEARNRKVRAIQEHIEEVSPGFQEYLGQQLGLLGRTVSPDGTLAPRRGSRVGQLTEVNLSSMTAPKTRKQLEERVKVFERAAKMPYAQMRRVQRRNLCEMLRATGEFGAADLVQRMTNDEFDVLSNRTDVWDIVKDKYEGDMEFAHESQQEFETPHDTLMRRIYDAKTIGLDARQAKRKTDYYKASEDVREDLAVARFMNADGRNNAKIKAYEKQLRKINLSIRKRK